MENSIKKSVALIITSLSAFITPFMSSSINIALPTIGKEFSMDAVSLNWVATSFLLTSAMLLVPFGRLADIIGRKRIYIYGMWVYTLASIISAISPSGSILIASRVIQGIGSAMVFGTSMAILTLIFPPAERGKALGINVAMVYLGLSLGPFIGGIFTQHLGWRSLFGFNILMGLTLIVLIIWKLKGEWADSKGEKFDLAGSIIYSLSLVVLMYGFSLLPQYYGYILIAAGIAGIIIFIFFESRVGQPVLNINIFRSNPLFTYSNIAAFINYASTFAVTFLLSLYLQYVKGLSPQQAGTILVAQPIMMTIFSPLAGRMSDKIEPRLVASLGMAIITVCLFLFVLLGRDTSNVFIIGNLLALGFGYALFSSPNTNAVMSSVEKRYLGIASGVLGTMRLTGQMFSMGIAMLLMALFIGKVKITPEYFPQLITTEKVAFLIFGIICIGGVLASLVRGKKHN